EALDRLLAPAAAAVHTSRRSGRPPGMWRHTHATGRGKVLDGHRYVRGRAAPNGPGRSTAGPAADGPAYSAAGPAYSAAGRPADGRASATAAPAAAHTNGRARAAPAQADGGPSTTKAASQTDSDAEADSHAALARISHARSS